MHGYGYGMGGMLGMGWLWFWPFVLAAVLVILAVVWAWRRSGVDGVRDDSPEAILKRRFAAGEIDVAEYRSRLAELHH